MSTKTLTLTVEELQLVISALETYSYDERRYGEVEGESEEADKADALSERLGKDLAE